MIIKKELSKMITEKNNVQEAVIEREREREKERV